MQPLISDEAKNLVKDIISDYPFYASRCLKIRTKEGSLEPFVLNKAQKYFHARVEEQKKQTGRVRVIILKGRQQGCSTYIEGRGYWLVTQSFGMRAFILTHEEEATNNLFDMAKRFHENCPAILRPSTQASNSKELIFGELDSGYKLGTAGNKSTGRSQTVQFLHASEAAFYKHASEHAKGILQTVPLTDNTEIFIESTANGVGNWFHQLWQAAEAGLSDYIPVFLPWFWQDEYAIDAPSDFKTTSEEDELKALYYLTNNQLAWRRLKIQELSVDGVDGVKSFKQEYPNNPAEAFQMSGEDSFISPELVMSARRNIDANPYGPLLIGADIARFGDDRTAIARRQGRVVTKIDTYVKKDTMEIAGILHNIIINEQPTKVFVDVGGLGASVVDRLYELGHRDIVASVNSATRALDAERFANKRAEMWALGREWLQDEPVRLPDLNSLHSDLCSTKYKVDSKGRLLIEAKADMKSRGVRSSDEADAVLLTFALPVSAYEKKKTDHEATSKTIMSTLTRVNKLKKARYQ
jgi:hypothetical protein